MTEPINNDFIKAYRILDDKLSRNNNGVTGYLAKAATVRAHEKDGHPNFNGDIDTLQKMRSLYLYLTETQNGETPIASEDDIDYLYDFARRLDEGRDPLAALKTAPLENNPEARKYLPIETTSREISRKVISQKKHLTAIALAAAIITVAATLAAQWKRGKKYD